ncbi:MAG: hypothetical protein AAGB34_03285, partial [Planctomycetota bacterium]
MTINAAQYRGRIDPPKKKVYYSGSDQLEVGYALCYADATPGPAAGAEQTGLGIQVTKPLTAILNLFAGTVATPNKNAGPGWIEIYEAKPGVFIDAFTSANATKHVTVLGPANDSYALAAKSDSTFNLAAVA